MILSLIPEPKSPYDYFREDDVGIYLESLNFIILNLERALSWRTGSILLSFDMVVVEQVSYVIIIFIIILSVAIHVHGYN